MKTIKNNSQKTILSIMSSTVLTLPLILLSSASYAQKVTVKVQNLTHGSHFTPLLIAAHKGSAHLFKSGEAASTSLQAMAEGGDISGLVTDLSAESASLVQNPAGGLLAPGHSATTSVINTDGTDNNYLSIVAMVLPSNDGFVGVNSWHIPSAAGTYMIPALAYDAGTEANDELLGLTDAGAPGNAGAPGAPSGSGGTGGTGAASADNNKTVHIHRGVLGDTNASGGASDFDSRVHRWLNPVARVTITVAE